jgi:hypothetical protein
MIECLPNCRDAGQLPKYPPIRTIDYINEKFTRQFLFEEWSDENSVTFGTADTKTRFKDNQSST